MRASVLTLWCLVALTVLVSVTYAAGDLEVDEEFARTSGAESNQPLIRQRRGLFKSLFRRLKDQLKKQTEKQKKEAEMPDPSDIERIISMGRDRDRDNRRGTHSTGVHGREYRERGWSGHQIEGAFAGDTGREVKQVESRRDRDRGNRRNDRPGRHGRTHRERGAGGRSIEH